MATNSPQRGSRVPHADPGHLASALLARQANRAVALHEQGYASPRAIDTAMRLGCGLPRGPFEVMDSLGLDAVRTALVNSHLSTGAPPLRPAPLLDRMIAENRTGRAVGSGFLRYDRSGARLDPAPAPAPAPGRPVARIGVVGSGTMASGIAQVAVLAGVRAVLVARDAAKAVAAVARITGSLARAVERGKLTEDAREEAVDRLTAAHSATALGQCDLVVEAVAEDASVKREVFTALDGSCRDGAVLATTTSSLSVAECATATRRPADVVGMHFFNPAPSMRLVELVRARTTGDDAYATAHGACAAMGKTAVECGDQAGFVVNRLLFPYLNDAVNAAEHTGVAPETVDRAVQDRFGHPLGPFALLDTIGLDVSLAIQEQIHARFGEPGSAPAPGLRALVDAGRLGRKSGAGFRC